MNLAEHFEAYLHELKFWPTAEEQRQAGADEALRLHAQPGWEKWTAPRRAVAEEQLTYRWTGIDVGPIDGLAGPQTSAAREAYAWWLEHGALPTWRDDDPSFTDGAPTLPAATKFPLQSQMGSFYGTPGPDIQRQLVRVRCPWRLRIAWNLAQTTDSISIHAKCAESLEAILAAVLDRYGAKAITELGLDLYGGSYNHRTIRGGTGWSTHAYGAAIDWDPARNALNTRWANANFSKSEYEDWWRIWEAAGWLSLGRARGYDAMHIQAALL